MPSTREDKIQRSVDSLERLFSVVVGLAVTIAVQKILFDPNNTLYEWYDTTNNTYPFLKHLLDRLPAMLAFIVSIVPFYHGMNRHLDRTYIEKDVAATKEGYLVIDFFIFFIESCILVTLASLVSSGDKLFLVLGVLLIVDAVWCFATHGIHYGSVTPSTITWGWINLIAFVALLVVYFLQLFPAGATRSWILAIVACCRTIADYKTCWKFYFPDN
jgi:hypothetical protein